MTDQLVSMVGLGLLAIAGAFAVGCLVAEIANRVLDRFWPTS